MVGINSCRSPGGVFWRSPGGVKDCPGTTGCVWDCDPQSMGMTAHLEDVIPCCYACQRGNYTIYVNEMNNNPLPLLSLIQPFIWETSGVVTRSANIRNADCLDVPFGGYQFHMNYTISCAGGIWRATAFISGGAVCDGGFVFDAYFPAPAAGDTVVIANGLAAGDCSARGGTSSYVGYDGTMVLEIDDCP